MAIHPPIVFSGINSEQYAKFAAKARAAGIDIAGTAAPHLSWACR